MVAGEYCSMCRIMKQKVIRLTAGTRLTAEMKQKAISPTAGMRLTAITTLTILPPSTQQSISTSPL